VQKIRANEWKGEKKAAEQIEAIFRTGSLPAHATPVSIGDEKEIDVTALHQATQQMQFITCVASCFNLRLIT
jgi:hypothetical protein